MKLKSEMRSVGMPEMDFPMTILFAVLTALISSVHATPTEASRDHAMRASRMLLKSNDADCHDGHCRRRFGATCHSSKWCTTATLVNRHET